jgi:Uma2 family endonuclease
VRSPPRAATRRATITAVTVTAHELDERPIRLLRRSEYDRLVSSGAFESERLELLYGQLVTMSPQGTAHAFSLQRLSKSLTLALGQRADVRIQLPLAASDDSEPEPDVAVVDIRDYLDDHPSACHLVIEVADSSRKTDLELKARLYAEMNVPDYWVVDLARRELVVHRDPAADRYREVRTFGAGASVEVLRFPDIVVRVDDVLPPA